VCQVYYIKILYLAVKKELYKEKGIPMEDDEVSSPIVNNNHFSNKKKHSQSNGK
jgi:hypothetical protein